MTHNRTLLKLVNPFPREADTTDKKKLEYNSGFNATTTTTVIMRRISSPTSTTLRQHHISIVHLNKFTVK
jgi:hypothetical protein